MPPIIVNKPVKMFKAKIIVPKWYVDKTIALLQRKGVLHIEKAGEGLREYKKLFEKVEDTISKINKILESAKGKVVDVSLTLSELESLSLEEISKEVNNLYMRLQELLRNISEEEKKLEKIKNLYNVLGFFELSVPLDNIFYRGKYFIVVTIYGSFDQKDAFTRLCREKNIDIKIIREYTIENMFITSFLTSFPLHEILQMINACGLKYIDITDYLSTMKTVGELTNYLDKEIDKTKHRLEELRNKVKELVENNIEYLSKYLLFLENKYSELETLFKSFSSKHLSLIIGWVPYNVVEDVRISLNKAGIPSYIELKEPVYGVDEPPTLMNNPPVIRWFEPIVKFIGAPRYWEWDPTPIISYSFALFYGIMLGDMGYAIAIILAALFLLDKFVIDPRDKDYIFFKKAIITSSIVGFIFGLLSGTFLGNTLSLIGIRYSFTTVFSNPLSFLVLAILIGLVHVNIAHVLTLIKAIKHRNTGDILSEIGIFVTEIFGIPYILYKMLHTPIPGIPEYYYNMFLYGAFAGIIILIIGTVKNMGGLGLLMWLFGLTGLLGDVLSYSRLAGVGLATVYLAVSFNAIASIAFNGLSSTLPGIVGVVVGGVLAAVILAFGHIVNTALSALGSFIHSLRLCFVEFLSKFYEGTGYLFTPFKIVLRKRFVIE